MLFLSKILSDLNPTTSLCKKIQKIRIFIFTNIVTVLLCPALSLGASSIKFETEELAKAMIYADASMWDKAFEITEKLSEEAARDLIQWLKLRQGVGSKSNYINFIEKNPHWPGMRLLRLRAEQKIYIDYRNEGISLDESLLVLFFQNPPQTGEGLFLFAELISKTEETEEAFAILSKQWTTVEFSDTSFLEFTEKFRKKYELKFSERVEKLLWDGKYSAVEQLAKLSSYKLSNTEEIRLKYQKHGKNLAGALSSLSIAEANQPGVVFERFRYRMDKKFLDSASDLILSNSDQGFKVLGKANKWAPYRMRLVKYNLGLLRFSLAYDIASKHYLESGEANYFELEWIAGFIAFHHLKEYELALSHFYNSYETTSSSESKAKVKYFLGKTLKEMDKYKESQSAFLDASHYIDTVHGQVSFEILNVGNKSFSIAGLNGSDEFGPILTLDTIRLGLLLSYSGRTVLGDWFLQSSAKLLNSQEKHDLVKSLSNTGHHMSVISIINQSKALREKNISKSHPIPHFWKFSNKTLEPLYLAIAREESKFYIGSRSSTGALGLMQLMPKTAEMTARELRIPFLPKRLRVDWEYNLKIGSHYIKKLIRRYDYSMPIALAAYNAGPSRVNDWLNLYGDPRKNEIDMLSWIQCIPFDETRGYVSRVLASVALYKGLLNDGSFKFDYLDREFLIQTE